MRNNTLQLDETHGSKPIDALSDMTLFLMIDDPVGIDKRYTVSEELQSAAAHVWLERYANGNISENPYFNVKNICNLASFIITRDRPTLPPPPPVA